MPLIAVARNTLAVVVVALASLEPVATRTRSGRVQPPAAPFVPATGQAAPGVVPPPSPAPQTPARDRQPGEPERGTAALRGIVVAADTGTPLRRAVVRAFSTSGGGNGMAQTDAQGRFEITQLPPGRYMVSATRSGYVTMSFGQRAPNQPGMPIALEDGQSADKVHFALARGGAITGRIVDEFGEPVSSAQVSAQRFGYSGGGRRLLPAGSEGGNDRTDDLGQFRLYGLSPGEYYVTATLRSNDFMPPGTSVGTQPNEGYAPTYYPGTPNAVEARRVSVRAGQELANVSFALSATRVGRISGRVTTSAGEPFVGAMVMVHPRDESLGFMSMMTSGTGVRPDGTFQTGGLPPGTYSLTVQPRGDRSDPNPEVARVDVPVNGEDVADVFIVTGRGGIIRGRVITDDGTVPPFKPELMRVMPQPVEPGRALMSARPGTVRMDWTFELTGLTDPVRLGAFVESAPGWSVRHAFREGIDLMDTPVDVAPGRVIEDVELVLTRKVTEVSGVVTDERGQPVTDVSVVVFPGDQERWTFGTRYIRTARPDTTGRYTIRLTPTDGLRAIAVRGLESGQSSDPEFLAKAIEQAVPLEIREGESKTIDLRVK